MFHYKNKFIILILFLVSSYIFTTEAELVDSRLQISLSQNFVERYLFFQSVEQQNILVDLGNRQFQYFSNVYREFLAKIISNSNKLSLTLKSSDKIFYNFRVGVITSQSGNFENVENKFSSFNKYGWIVNINGNYSLFPETIVSQSISLGLGINIENYNFNSFANSNNVFYIDTNFRIIDIFCSLLFNKKLKSKIDLFYGFDLVRRTSFLIDNINFYEISGSKYFLNFVIGNKIFITKKEGIFISFTKSIEQNGDFVISAGFVLEN